MIELIFDYNNLSAGTYDSHLGRHRDNVSVHVLPAAISYRAYGG